MTDRTFAGGTSRSSAVPVQSTSSIKTNASRLDELRLPDGGGAAVTPRKAERAPRYPRQTAPFIKGPIPLAWYQRAVQVPNRGLAVGIALWYFAGLEKSPTLAVSQKRLAKVTGLSTDTVARALNGLDDAGLVKVSRKVGARSTFTIVRSIEDTTE